MIVFIGRLAGWRHFDDLPSRLARLCHILNSARRTAMCMLRLCECKGGRMYLSLRGSTRTSSDNCQKTETCTVGAYHTPRQQLQNNPSGHLEGWPTPWSAEEMLDGQRVDIPANTRTAHKGLLQKRLKRISAELSFMSPRRFNRSRD